MESSLDRSNESLNPQQPFKVDDKQNLFANTLVIGTVESISQSSGLGLNHTVQSAIDKWAGKQAIDLSTPINNPVANSNSAKATGITIVQPEVKIYTAPLAGALTVVPIVGRNPANIAPLVPVITGLKASYDANSTLSIINGLAVDKNGWKDVIKVDFWLTDNKGKRIELADATSFLLAQDANTAKFNYSVSLKGIVSGDYKLNAVIYDKAGLAGTPFTQAFNIKPANVAPTAPVITGLKASYDANSVLSIANGLAADKNGWKDVSKVDFWLTDNKGKRIELADATSFLLAQDANTAKFNYSVSLKGIASGDYKLNAVTYDKAGVAGTPFTQSFNIKPVKPVNVTPTAPVITGLVDPAFVSTFNGVSGATVLGKTISNIRAINGGKVQEFEKGSIFQSPAGTFALHGTLNNFYKDLSAADKLRLGMPTANETSVGGWHQSFQNGELQLVQGMPVKWSNQTLITDRFNLLGGATALGNAVGTIHDLNGSAVQDYEKGSIFISGNKTVAVTGSIAAYHRANSATLGLPTGEEVTTIYGKRQDFQGAAVMSSAQFGVHTLHGSLVGYYTGLTAAQKDQLGAATTEEAVGGDGNWQQFFKGGSVLWKSNGTGEVKLTPFTVGFDGGSSIPVFRSEFNKVVGSDGSGVNPAFTTKFNAVVGWDSLGKATGKVRSIAGGTVQDFEKGSIFQSAKGTFVLDGILSEMYRQEYSSIGFPIGDKVSTVNGLRQDFENGTLISTATAQTFALKGEIASYYIGLNDAQLKVLGAPLNNATNVNGGVAQFFQNGAVCTSSVGTFSSIGKIGEYAIRRGEVGVPLGEAKVTSYGLRQDFSGGSVLYSDKTGVHTIIGEIGKYYQSLTESQKSQLGVDYSPFGNNASFQCFQGGVIELNRNGASQVRFTPGVGFDGNTFNEKFFDKFMSMGNFDGLGDPITNVFVSNGILRQDFMKGIITQNGSLVEGKPYGGTIPITNDPPNNSGNVIVITSNSPNNNSGTISVEQPIQYTTETRTISVPAQNPIPSPVTNASSSADSSLARNGLDIVYIPLSGTVVDTDSVNLRSDAPYTSSQLAGKKNRNETLQFDAWARGEYIEGRTDVWLHIAGSRNWVSARYIQTNSVIGEVFSSVNFKGIVNSTDEINVRSKPNTNFARVDSYRNQTELSFDGYATGESINGNNRWYRIAGTQNWVSSYLIFGSPENSVSLESTRPTTKTETVRVPVTNPTPQQSNQNPIQSNPTNSKFSEGSVDTNTNWSASVYKWDTNNGKPPANFYDGGYNSPNALAELNLGSNTLSNGTKGIKFEPGLGALKGYNDRLPSDGFAVRAYTQASFDGGNYTFKVRGDDGFQIFAKNIVTNEWIYITPQNEWQSAYGNYQEVTKTLSQGRYDLHFHYFEGGGAANFDLAWDKVSSPTVNNPTPNPGYSPQIVSVFPGTVMVSGGINVRSGPGTNYSGVDFFANGKALNFDAVTTGTAVYDQVTKQYDDRWFRIQGTNNWVASALINGNPGGTSVPGDSAKGGTTRTGGSDALQYYDYWGRPMVDSAKGYTNGGNVKSTPSYPLFEVTGQGPLALEYLKFTLLPHTVEQANKFFKTEIKGPYNPTYPHDNQSVNCGPASLAIIIKMLGLEPKPNGISLSIETSIEHARSLMNFKGGAGRKIVEGVEVIQANIGLENFVFMSDIFTGISTIQDRKHIYLESSPIEILSKLDSSLRNGDPAILTGKYSVAWQDLLNIDKTNRQSFAVNHVIAVLGMTLDGKYIVGDPMNSRGTQAMNAKELEVFLSEGNYSITVLAKN